MKFLFVTLLLFVAGCASKPAPVVMLPLAETVPVAAARIAPVIGHYTLGAYIDPDNEAAYSLAELVSETAATE